MVGPTFVLLTGSAGSGKSTTAAAWAAQGTEPRAVLDVDQLRALIKAGFAHPEHGWNDETERQWTIGTELCAAMARVYKRHGVSVIIDVYAPPWPGDAWSTLIGELGGTVVTMLPSFEVCRARNTVRARQPILVEADLRANYDAFAENVALQPPDHLIDNSDVTVEQVVEQIQGIVNASEETIAVVSDSETLQQLAGSDAELAHGDGESQDDLTTAMRRARRLR